MIPDSLISKPAIHSLIKLFQCFRLFFPTGIPTTLLWITLVIVVFSTTVQAQSTSYAFNHYTIREGLSSNQINCMLRDSRGFMWIGTALGLNQFDGYTSTIFRHKDTDTNSISRDNVHNLFEGPDHLIWINIGYYYTIYDPATGIFHRDLKPFLRKYGIPAHSIWSLQMARDKKGNYWFTTADAGLIKYLPTEKRTITIRHNLHDSLTIYSDKPSAFAEDSQGDLWLVHRDGVVEQLDGKTHRIKYRTHYLQSYFQNTSEDLHLFLDSENDVWVYSTNSAKGVFHLNRIQNSWLSIHTGSKKGTLNNNVIRSIVQDTEGLIWIGTDHGGINILNKKDFSVQYLLNNPSNSRSISQNSISTMYRDPSGIIWVGTHKKGINYYHKNIIRFSLFQHQPADPSSIPYDESGAFAEDKKGNLWIGTNGGGLIYYDRSNGRFTRFLHDPNKPGSLSSNVIVSLCIDYEQKVWIGTYMGGLDCYDGKKFIHYRHNPNDPTSLASNDAWRIFEDSRHTLWIGTLGGGLDYFDRDKNRFYHYRTGNINSIHSDYISAITEDKKGNLWIGTAYGVDVLDRRSGRFTHYLNDKQRNSISGNTITAILVDNHRGLIWIGTTEGLNIYDEQRNTFQVIKEKDGFPSNSILSILADRQQQLWIGTSNGIANLKVKPPARANAPYTLYFKNYDESDGLPGKELSENTAFRTSRGELIFGGPTGFTIFDPESITVNKELPKVVLSDLQLLNQQIALGDTINGRVLLTRPISETRKIVLQPGENAFTIGFATLSYFQPEKNKYRYKLEGFDQQWIATDASLRKATYTNLDPGEYVFHVKASNNDGFWNPTGASIKIIILPPFWKTRIAFVCYLCCIVAALLLARRLIMARERMRFVIEQERQAAQRVHEMDLMKIKFFTNVSHEFRTPLSLILTPLEKMLQHPAEVDVQKQLPLVYRNARRLLNLVNQLLDFRKMEVQELKLQLTQGDIVQFIKEAAYSFSDISEKKNIQFSFQSNISQLHTLFDQDNLEKIFFNLLSNAFKFTQGYGKVTVDVNFSPSPATAEGSVQWLHISVSDTGIGIPLEKQEKIFERFFQNDMPGTIVNQGSGIGLSITKEFVKLHGGTIQVKSEPNAGSCFTVVLPVIHVSEVSLSSEPMEEAIQASIAVPVAEESTNQDKDMQLHEKPVVLLAEDNEDFRFYLKDNLKEHYTIVEAANGKEAWTQAHVISPDLIVSDIMMPGMDGIELCRKIKKDSRTSHIPIVLLTAHDSDLQKLTGFQTGAIDYITKPFNFEILQSRLKSILAQQESLRKSFQKYLEVKPNDINITSQDEKLIQEAIALVEKHIADPNFSVEDMSNALAISRIKLYRKLLALTGKPPLEFIRFIRMKRAAQLLEKSQQTVAEIAYQVGFNNPKYFAKHFKMEFKILPSAYAAQKQNSASKV